MRIHIGPGIVKIDNAQRSSTEAENFKQAREILGPIVPAIVKQANIKGQVASVVEYATGSNNDYSVYQFGEFYLNQGPDEIGDLLKKVLGQALLPFYRKQSYSDRTIKQLYFLPRLHQGEYDRIDAISRHSKYYHAEDDTLVLPVRKTALPNPGTYLKPPPKSPINPDSPHAKFFLSKREMGLCLIHGDLNPRNFLIDGIGNIHIIDFCEMKFEGSRFADFVRIEVETKFRLAKITTASLDAMLALESLLVDSNSQEDLDRLRQLPLDVEFRKMAYAVITLRQIARSICDEKTSDERFGVEYKLGLLAQTMRISLFQDYLSETQQEFAVLSSALLIDYLNTRLP